MFTRSLVIQKRVDDLQLGVESYQKKINVTKPETTKPSIKKRDPYTPYQDPQGFIYVNTLGRNRLMRLDEFYKFSDRTLTGLQTSLDDITKNIRMEYLPKRRWSTLEKRRDNILIKAIDKQLKERRVIRSLKRWFRFSVSIPMIKPEQGESTKDIPLDSVEVLGYKKRSKVRLSNNSRVLRIILVILPEHQSDTKVIHNNDGNPSRANIKQALVKELQERCIIKAFKLSYQEKYEHVGPKLQDHKMTRLQDDAKRLCLVDDLKKFKITFISSQRYKSKPNVKDHYNIS
ncbi:hypothetical protein Tco_0704607 [Tanacetum coccineum]|uniref:Translocon at the inner envelope membrane of chloroplasts 214 n=1 Tax=Tanacetum coccineum TaxID=301880 RepID=A0ABQ4Y321_9ASTR